MNTLRILCIEDEERYRQAIDISLIGCEFAYELEEVDTTSDALQVISNVANGEHDPIDVVLLDANLESTVKDGSNGKAVIQHIQELGLSPHIIGFSAERMTDYGIEVDYDLGKENLVDLPAIILEIARKKHEAA